MCIAKMIFHMNFRLVFSALAVVAGLSQSAAQTAAEYFSLAKTLHSQGRMAEAIAFYEESLNLDPENTNALFDRGAAYFTEGQYENAGRDFKKVADLNKHDAEANERLANCFFMQKLYKEAIVYYEKSLRLEKSSSVQISCSLARQEAGDFEGAVADAEKAIEMDHENPRAWSAKATALFRVGQVETAVAAWREAAQRTPGDADLLANLGAGLCEMGIFRESLGWLNKSITLEASAKAYINRAHCFLETDNLDAALADIESADKMEPASADVFNIRGLYFLKMNEPERAVKSFSNAIAWSPNHPNALYNRAQVEYTMGNYREALADLNRLIEQRPKAARARYARARAHYELQEFEAACDDFREAQNLGLADVSDEYGHSFCRK